MLRLYYASRRRGGYNPHGVSSINLGDIYYLQQGTNELALRLLSRRSVCKEPWIVVGFTTRMYETAERKVTYRDNRQVDSRYHFHTAHTAGPGEVILRSLRNGRFTKVDQRTLLCLDDNGFQKDFGVPAPVPIMLGYYPLVQRPYIPPRKKRVKRKSCLTSQK